MDQNQFNTDEAVRKSGSHLTLAERGMIQALAYTPFDGHYKRMVK